MDCWIDQLMDEWRHKWVGGLVEKIIREYIYIYIVSL